MLRERSPDHLRYDHVRRNPDKTAALHDPPPLV
jgi:hypothetical protein